MDTQTLKRLEAAGFVATTVAEFLELSPAEEALLETKIRFTDLLRETRLARGLTQKQLAQALATTQQTIARAERGDRVTLDFLLRALVTLDLSLADLGAELCALSSAGHTADDQEADEPLSDGMMALSKDTLIAPTKLAAAATATGPVLQLLRGGFATSQSLTGTRRTGNSSQSEHRSEPQSCTGELLSATG